MNTNQDSGVWTRDRLVRGVILLFWTCFWSFNVVDKAIGGSTFLWVGRDRFAQFQKYFASAGLESPWIADLALYVAAALEVFALVFFAGALWNFTCKRAHQARSWCFIGIIITLVTFTFFSIGDHLFGDRFELLEHTLFWFITLASWGVYVRLESQGNLSSDEQPKRPGRYGGSRSVAILAIGLVTFTTGSIFKYNNDFFYRRTSALDAEPVGEDLFKVAFPFLGGSQVFEETLAKFQREYPNKSIDHIYTAPNPLRLKKADALIFYIATKDRMVVNAQNSSTHE
ncbi:MAG: hypothetical protein CL828_00415 [Crocinitomicaceae bacterium]|nr:hypothetical protein [Crocinitomicaceae bacterium]